MGFPGPVESSRERAEETHRTGSEILETENGLDKPGRGSFTGAEELSDQCLWAKIHDVTRLSDMYVLPLLGSI